MFTLSHFSRIWLFAAPWTITSQVPLFMGFCKQEYWSGLPCPPPGDLPDSGIKPISLMSPGRRVLYHWATWEAHKPTILQLKKIIPFFWPQSRILPQFLAPVWWKCCTSCRDAGSWWGLAGDRSREEKGKRDRAVPTMTVSQPPHPTFPVFWPEKESFFCRFVFFCLWLPFSSGIWSP